MAFRSDKWLRRSRGYKMKHSVQDGQREGRTFPSLHTSTLKSGV